MPRLLIIDDDTTTLDLLRDVLTSAGHQVVATTDGRQGLELSRAAEFDLVLTDVVMPDFDGIEIIMSLRYQRPGLPVIAMSGAPTHSDLYLRIARRLGANRTLSKPFTIETLLQVVDDALRVTV